MAGMDSRTDPGVPDSVRKMEKVNQKSLPERTADAVMSMLHHENYGVGQKLPNEIKMAERFEVSRSTIRQAEKILEQRGILVIERGAGTFVSGSMGVNEIKPSWPGTFWSCACSLNQNPLPWQPRTRSGRTGNCCSGCAMSWRPWWRQGRIM